MSRGYAQKFVGSGWAQITGNEAQARAKSRTLNPPEGSRRVRRAKFCGPPRAKEHSVTRSAPLHVRKANRASRSAKAPCAHRELAWRRAQKRRACWPVRCASRAPALRAGALPEAAK
jgi:hypothetical protein